MTRNGTEQKFIEGICNGMAKKLTEMKRIGTELMEQIWIGIEL